MTQPKPNTPVFPAYIERGGEQSLVAPGTLNSTQFYIFMLKGQQAKLQAMADRLFNHPSGGAVEYRALSDYVVLMFTHVDQLTSGKASQGWAAYHDIAMWIPMVAVNKTLGVDMADRIVMYPPYLLVDNASTLVTGREVYGLPKQWGWFNMPQDPNYAGDFTADVVGYSAGSPTRQTVQTRLWSVQRQSATFPVSSQPLKGITEVVGALRDTFKNVSIGALPMNLPKMLSQAVTGIPALGLRQLRNAAHPERAAYQEIIETPLRVKRFRGGWVYADPFNFVLHDLPTHPIAEETGLSLGSQKVALSLYLHLDMEMGFGTTQWKSGIKP